LELPPLGPSRNEHFISIATLNFFLSAANIFKHRYFVPLSPQIPRLFSDVDVAVDAESSIARLRLNIPFPITFENGRMIAFSLDQLPSLPLEDFPPHALQGLYI